MSVKSAQSVTVLFITSRVDTGAATNADSLPTGTLYLNGTSNAASVTVTNIDTGRYKAAVTLPTLAVADIVELSIAATVNSVSGKGVIWRDTADVALDATGRVTVGTNADKTGYTLTQAFPANFASLAITAGGAMTAGTNNDKTGYTLTQAFPTNFSSFAITAGGAVTAGTVSDKTGYALTAAYDPAKTAAQVGSAMTLTAAYDPAKTAAQAGNAMTLTSAYDFAKGTTAMTEAYAADGAAATPVQMFHMLWSVLADFAITGTTITTRKLDGTTTAMAFSLDSATAPTSKARSL